MIRPLYLILISFTIIFVQIKQKSCQFSVKKPIDCLIHNQKYSHEYLYASNNIFITDLLKIHHKIYTISIKSLEDDYDRVKWTINQMTDQSNGTLTVTIKSNSGQYLCASNLYQDLFRKRRKIFLKIDHYNRNDQTDCKWRLNKIGFQTYTIRNDLFNEHLYAPSLFYMDDLVHRNVYLFKNKQSNTGSEFKWLIDCKKEHFLLE